jgi:flavin reductase (DIM6/NTAB) family NADH-FMN oxidoreductase RutF
MKQEIKTTEAIFPMPVLMISTFNEDGSVDVMNAAWGTMLERDRVALNLTETHKTVQNIKARKGFVVHIARVFYYGQLYWLWELRVGLSTELHQEGPSSISD